MKTLHGKTGKFHQHDDAATGGGNIKHPSSFRGGEIHARDADHLFKLFAQAKGYENPARIFFEKDDGKRNGLVLEYCLAAIENGRSAKDISETLIKWSYPFKLESHIDVSKGQAASVITISITSKVDWDYADNGGKPIVEGSILMNAGFGRGSTNHAEPGDVKAGAHYLPGDSMGKDLPQASMISFGGRSHAGNHLKEEILEVTGERSEFERGLGPTIVDDHHFKLADIRHDGTVKFRMLCRVFDENLGKIMVVSSDSAEPPVHFAEWVKSGDNLNDILSASKEELAKIQEYAHRQGGLCEQLSNPRNDDRFDPWKSLLLEVESSKGITAPMKNTGDIYRQAVKIWRYAILQNIVANNLNFERQWPILKQIEETTNRAIMKLGCDDGRQHANVKVLAGIVPKEEFDKLFVDSNPNMEKLQFVPHYKCGFLHGAQYLHDTFERLRAVILTEPDKFERDRKLKFFAQRMNMIIQKDGSGPVAEELVLRDYLPSHLADELDRFLKKKEPLHKENHAFVTALHEIFSGQNERMRHIIRRAIETEVMSVDTTTSFVHMPAAKETYKNLKREFGGEFRQIFGDDRINALIVEEVARSTLLKYGAWAKSKGFAVEMFAENFQNGQYTVVPENTPKYAKELENMDRTDYFLSRKFTPEEVASLKLEGKTAWTIPKGEGHH